MLWVIVILLGVIAFFLWAIHANLNGLYRALLRSGRAKEADD